MVVQVCGLREVVGEANPHRICWFSFQSGTGNLSVVAQQMCLVAPRFKGLELASKINRQKTICAAMKLRKRFQGESLLLVPLTTLAQSNSTSTAGTKKEKLPTLETLSHLQIFLKPYFSTATTPRNIFIPQLN